jgi:hypothetical protein
MPLINDWMLHERLELILMNNMKQPKNKNSKQEEKTKNSKFKQ